MTGACHGGESKSRVETRGRPASKTKGTTVWSVVNGPLSESEPREVHQARRAAESFGSDAELYDRTRPRYPDAVVERIVAASPGPHVPDVGCATGIAARQFQAAGCKVLGIEPDERMADFARQNGLEVEISPFEGWDPAGRAFEAVVAG